jgi:hypothetical protein
MILVDRTAQVGLLLGILLVLQPWLPGGLRLGFSVTLLATVLHIVTTHLLLPDKEG